MSKSFMAPVKSGLMNEGNDCGRRKDAVAGSSAKMGSCQLDGDC